MDKKDVWICSQCKEPVEIKEVYGELGVYCLSDKPCTPREDRLLLCGVQVERLDGTKAVEEGTVL